MSPEPNLPYLSPLNPPDLPYSSSALPDFAETHHPSKYYGKAYGMNRSAHSTSAQKGLPTPKEVLFAWGDLGSGDSGEGRPCQGKVRPDGRERGSSLADEVRLFGF